MTLAFGRHHLSIPGPSVMPDRVLRAMHRASPNIYAGELIDITEQIKTQLKSLAQCSADIAIYIGNGHAAWEASLCNGFSRGDKVLGLTNGRFGTAWLHMAKQLGIDTQELAFEHNQTIDANKLESLLREDAKHEIKAVLTVQTDTSSSITNDILSIRRAIDAAGHPALLMVDCIASFGCEPFFMDDWGVDVMVCASQKGLMTPPGLGFMFVGQRFWSHQKTAELKTPYWDCEPRVNPPMYPDHFCGTAPTHHLFALHEALTMIEEEGKENIWTRHQILAQAVWASVEAWSSTGVMQFNVQDESVRSPAVTTIVTGESDVASRLREWCEHNAGVTLGVGLSPSPTRALIDNVFRIGHMGHLSPPMLMGTLGSIEAGLCALHAGHGAGALDAAANVLSQHAK